jgi:hypothetical protein
MSRGFGASLLAAAVVGAGCAGGSGTSGTGVARSAPLTLPASAVPYLPSSMKMVSSTDLAREVRSPALATYLGAWGFVEGSDRYFQGESRRLQVVDSRTLRFDRAGGARAYVGFMRGRASAILGSFPVLKEFVSRGRSGFVAVAQQCQCHLANPALLAVLARGGMVTWLEINGPGATKRELVKLLAGAP